MTTPAEEAAYRSDEEADSFVASDTHMLGDLPLEPWTPSRIVAAQAMGLKYPYISPEDTEQFNRTSIYPGALQDIAIALWLCTLTDKAEVRRALRLPGEALEKAITWAHSRGITTLRSDVFWQAYEKFLDIVVQANSATVVPSNDRHNGSTPDPN